MSAAALPYTVVIVLVELAAGTLAIITLFDARRMVTAGFVKLGAVIAVPALALALGILPVLASEDEVDGYSLAQDWLPAFRISLIAFAVVVVAHAVASLVERRSASRWLGALASAAGIVTFVMLAALIAQPAWSYAGVLVGLLAGAAVLGGTTVAMCWGHWYLTNAGLPKEPLERMALLVLGALALQAALIVIGATVSVREVPLSGSLDVALGSNPAFWLRVGVGLVFPLLLTTLAWRAATIRGMMSATGLLYLALGSVLTGELLGRGLLFATGAAV